MPSRSGEPTSTPLATFRSPPWTTSGGPTGTPSARRPVSGPSALSCASFSTGPWQAEELADKPATGFTASYEEHGGQEATLLSLYQTFHHWGSIILPTGYLNYDTAHGAGGNPYGVSQVESRASRDPEYARAVLETACFQGARLTRMAAALAAARADSKLG